MNQTKLNADVRSYERAQNLNWSNRVCQLIEYMMNLNLQLQGTNASGQQGCRNQYLRNIFGDTRF